MAGARHYRHTESRTMPSQTCPHCQAVNALPDGWSAPGYTCHHCRQAVPLLYPTAPKPDPLADMLSDRDDGVPVRRRTHRPRSGTGSFSDGFGWTMGEQFAKLLFGLVGTAIVFTALYIFWTNYFKK